MKPTVFSRHNTIVSLFDGEYSDLGPTVMFRFLRPFSRVSITNTVLFSPLDGSWGSASHLPLLDRLFTKGTICWTRCSEADWEKLPLKTRAFAECGE